MAADELGRRMEHDVGAERQRPAQHRRGEGVVDHQRDLRLVRDIGDGRDVENLAAGIADRLAQHQPRLGPDRLGEAVMVARIDEGGGDAEARQGQPQHVARAAIERGRGDDVAARSHQRGDGDVQRRLAARHAQRARALLERRDALLEHGDGGIGDAAVDVAADLEVEQARGMIDVAEHEGRRLVDRHGARAGDRIGMLAGMQGQRVGLQELGFDHGASPTVRSSRRRTPERVPCMLDAVSEARNTARPAICSTVVNWSCGCFSPISRSARLLHADAVGLGLVSIWASASGVEHEAGADRVAGDAGVGAFDAHHLGQADQCRAWRRRRRPCASRRPGRACWRC